ncbi:hypothetical protein D9613_002799 [Agrocybe pediades]|uniref:Uncharacterized protein n=1 Tax=Agrocybe pediades TaxID=84607 RepID=A0A8H4QQF6_9AGAR|nr:hypothetical protein D9613_002799 [Agrocybe pediades]
MGSSASKAARSYPAARQGVSHGSRQPQSAPSSAQNRPVAAETRSEGAVILHSVSHVESLTRLYEAIEKDGADPQFLSNLSSLGPVRVDHHMQTIRPEAQNTARLFESRAKSEASSSSGLPKEKVYAFVLSDLLDKRKAVKSSAELGKLCEEYGFEASRLESLARFVSSPSIDKSTIRPAAGKSEEEGFLVTAVWMQPSTTRK